MRRRLNILTLICCSLLCTVVGVSDVLADTDYTNGTSAAIKGCSSGMYCYTGAVGFRITLVNKTTGERCKYDSSTNTICGSDGKNTNSKDYWFDTSDLAFNESSANYSRNCYSYNKKRTKYEFLSSTNKGENIDTNCSKAEESFVSLGFPGVGSNKYTGDWTTSDSRIEVSRAPQNMNLVERYLSCTLGGVDENKAKLDCTSKDGTTISEDYTIINNIFTKLIGKEIDVTKIEGLDNTSIQFEQLLQIGNYSKNLTTMKDIHSALVTRGTVAEASYLYMKKGSNNSSGSVNFGCVTNTTTGFNTTPTTNCGSSMVGGGYFTGFYASTAYSQTLKNVPSSTSPVVNLSQYENGGKYDVDLNQFLKYDTSNIFNFWINPDIGPKCDDEFQNLLKFEPKSHYTKDNVVNKESLIEYLNDNKNAYKTLIEDCAIVKNDKVIGFKTGENSCPLLENLDKMTLVLSSEMDTSNYGCLTDIACEDAITFITSKYKDIINTIRTQIYDNGNLEYESSSKIYNKLMNLMVTLFKGFPRLYTDIWATLGDSGPSCKTVPDCPGTSAELSCSDTNKTISSNTDPKCIKQGILYTLKSGNEVTALQSSLNTSYTDECENCKVYCSESVRFDLSGQKELDNKITEAGTLLKWGRGKDSQIFGTMTVKQTCYVIPNSGKTIGKDAGLNSATIRSHLGSPLAIDEKKSTGRYVNTKVTIDYTNPASYLKDSNDKLDQKVTLVAIPTTRGVLSIKHKSSNSIVDADENSPISLTEPSTTSLNYATSYNDTNHKNIESFDVIANYVFAYGEYSGCTKYDKDGNCISNASVNGGVDGKSELAWYADKSDNGSYKTAEEYEKVSSLSKNSYIFIGYGLPTPFTSVTCIYNSENMSTNNSNRDKAPINVTIQNVGTSKSAVSADDSNDYQFTKLLGNEKKLTYSCNYKIHNQMFGYENGDSIKCDYTSPKGLDVVFRTVDLMNSESEEELDRAFPGMSGKGITGGIRKIGSNWDKVYSAEDGANQLFNILNNSIYSKEPLYKIKLNVSLIQKIRNYNKTARKSGHDPYTDMTNEQEINGGKNATEASGFLGYRFGNDNSAYSAFLWYLSHDCTNGGKKCLIDNYKCITNKNANRSGCHQEWWNED